MKIRKHFFKICFISVFVALILLIIAVTTTSWIVIKMTDEINLPKNITEKFPKFTKLELEIVYSFGLTNFCVTKHNFQLQTMEKKCDSIAVFKEDLEKETLQDAMKFQILAISLLSISFLGIIGSTKLAEGHIKSVSSYVIMAFMFFSGTSEVSSLFMVTDTLTERSSIVTYNILAHRGDTSEIDLQGISTGASYRAGVAGILFIILGLLFFIGDFKLKKDENEGKRDNNYRLLPITRESYRTSNEDDD